MAAHIRSAVGALAIDSYATQSVLTESELFPTVFRPSEVLIRTLASVFIKVS